MVRGLIIVVFMIIMMILMMTKKMPTLIALIFLVLGISLIGGIPFMGEGSLSKSIITEGAIGMASSYVIAFIGSWLGAALNKTGVSEAIIRKAAELGGDKTLFVTLLLFVSTIFLCANINGLGGVIMIGTIVIPILISVGVDKLTAGCVMLLAVGAGNQLGLARPTYISNALGLDFDLVYQFSTICSVCTAVAAIVFVLFRYFKGGKKFAFAAETDEIVEKYEVKGFRGVLAMLTPFLTIILVGVFKWDVLTAVLFGIIWLFVWTASNWRRVCNLALSTCYEGFTLGAPSASLMIFIGMLLKTIQHEGISTLLVPLTNMITPTTVVAFILFFGLLAPLSLYRGPLTIYGLGAGIASLMISGGLLSAPLVCVGFISNGCLQTTSCPTNTHNVWVAGFVEEDVGAIMRKLMPFVWLASIAALVIGTVMYW